MQMQELLDEWGRPTHPVPAPPERIAQFAGRVPDGMLELWREVGFSGFQDGLLWLCDPVAWQPQVDSWINGIEGDWFAVWRSCFGDLGLWNPNTNDQITIRPVLQTIVLVTHAEQKAPNDEHDLFISLVTKDKDYVDIDSTEGPPLFDQILAMHGPVGPDEVYGFVPALALGGFARATSIDKCDGHVHLEILLALGGRELMTFDR
jgi:hypothetical protein